MRERSSTGSHLASLRAHAEDTGDCQSDMKGASSSWLRDRDNVEVLQQLFDLGAQVNGRLPLASTAIHRAIYHGNIQVLRKFLSICCSPDNNFILNAPGILQCDPEVFVWDRGWRRDLQENNIIFSPLEFATALGNAPAVHALLQYYPGNEDLLGDRSAALITAVY